MSLTLCSIMVSVCVGVILFSVERDAGGSVIPACFGMALSLFFVAAGLGIFASLLRTRYAVSTEAQFVEDLLSLFYTEQTWLRMALTPLLLGFLVITGGVVTFLLKDMVGYG